MVSRRTLTCCDGCSCVAIQDNERQCVRMDIPSDEERKPRTEEEMFEEAAMLLEIMDEIEREDA